MAVQYADRRDPRSETSTVCRLREFFLPRPSKSDSIEEGYCFAIETDVKGRMTKHIYVAGPYGRRDEAEALAKELWAKGFVITSRWHHGPPGDPPPDRQIAMQNWGDLQNAEIVVALIYPECHGTLFEIGGGIMSPDHDVFIVGERGHPYHSMGEHDSVTFRSREAIVNTLCDIYNGPGDRAGAR